MYSSHIGGNINLKQRNIKPKGIVLTTIMKTTNDLERMPTGYNFKRLAIGNYYLSIQGSEGHYCTPRKTVKSSEYVSFEMMIFHKTKRQFNWKQSPVFNSFPKIKELKNHVGFDGVFGWLPKEVIDELIIHLNKSI